MSRIKIKNFGPIKEGYHENDGWLHINKVTVFIGNQGSGKSTIAKLISTLTWIEKSINRGDIKADMTANTFFKYFEFQNIAGYFNDNTIINYLGDAYSILYDRNDKVYPIISKNKSGNYIVPKIMYVPAERNFLSVIKNATRVRGLPETLFDFAEELRKSQEFIGNAGLELPINNVFYRYDDISELSFIYNDEYSINMLEASSGFQSFVPLFLVSKNLSNLLSKDDADLNSNTVSVSQKIRFNNEITRISLSKNFSNEQKEIEYKKILSKYINKAFINIVEEPEQNLFPSSQKNILFSLLEFNNITHANKLILTTHSPYLINYLTLAVKAEMVKANLKNEDLIKKLDLVVPLKSTVNGCDLVIYQMNEKDGSIMKLGNFEGIPSDSNYLNQSLALNNQLFDSLLEIEDEI